jgi:hypothetical protein
MNNCSLNDRMIVFANPKVKARAWLRDAARNAPRASCLTLARADQD